MNTGTDVAGTQFFNECGPVQLQEVRIQADWIEMKRVSPARQSRWQEDLRKIGKRSAIHRGDLLAAKDEDVQPPQLVDAERGLNFRHVVFVARFKDFVAHCAR